MTTGKTFVSKHPLLQDKIGRLRHKGTHPADFRRLVGEITMLLGYEVLCDLKLDKADVQTPLGIWQGGKAAQEITIVSILRAGLGMAEGFMKLEPTARSAHIGVYRNEDTLEPVRYYARFPANIDKHYVVLADPMLATGGSAVEAIDILKNQGAKGIVFACIIAAKDGVSHVHKIHPDVPIYIGSLDEKLSDKGYILPGLGDAGDRMFGTV
jgi:uracil phosphoribosyltransferase